MHGQTPALAGVVDVIQKRRPAMSGRLINICCLQIGKARRSGIPYQYSVPTNTNPYEPSARSEAEEGILGLSVGQGAATKSCFATCTAPHHSPTASSLATEFSLAPAKELHDTVLCPGSSTRIGPDLFYLRRIPCCAQLADPRNQQTRVQAHGY